MSDTVNPYDHLPTAHLKAQLSRISKKMTKLALKGKQSDMFEQQRAIMLTISDSLDRRQEIEELNSLVNGKSAPPAS